MKGGVSVLSGVCFANVHGSLIGECFCGCWVAHRWEVSINYKPFLAFISAAFDSVQEILKHVVTFTHILYNIHYCRHTIIIVI